MKDIDLWILLHKVPCCSKMLHYMPLMYERAESLKMQNVQGIDGKKRKKSYSLDLFFSKLISCITGYTSIT